METDRLLLRQWRDDDLPAWAALNADPEVREFFPSVLTTSQAAASLALFRSELESRGWGWWALEERSSGRLIGMAGLDQVDEGLPFHGIEAGWRLAREAWGHGYATEAGRAVLAYGFEQLRLPEILAVAVAGNVRSHAVMDRLGMTRMMEFDDPAVPPGPLRRSVVYRLRR